MNHTETEMLLETISVQKAQIEVNIRKDKNDKLLLDKLERLNRNTFKVLVGTTLVVVTRQGSNVQVHTSEIDGIVS